MSRLGAVLLAVGLLAAPALAQAPAAPLREEVEQILREYLQRHPEVVVEALRAAEARRQAAERARLAETLTVRRADLVEDPGTPVGGNLRGDVTVVEFFDYRCGYCRQAAPILKQLAREDAGVRIVYKELPILGPESLEAARAALAAHGQGRYVAFHDALMAAEAPAGRASALALAASLGLDVARLERDMAMPEVMAALRRNLELARALGVNGTPAFIIGTELVPGIADLATLKRLVAQARAPR